MLSAPSLDSLAPRTVPLADGRDLQLFVSEASSLVKLDLTFEAGSRYQWLKSQAHAASQLVGEATALHEEAWVAEFLDFRGITLERSADVCTATLSFYFLRRYAAELLPVLREMVVMLPSTFAATAVGLVLGTIFLRDTPEESRDIDEFFRKANTPS